MSILTDEGRGYLDDLRYGRQTDPIDTIVLGRGTAAESGTNTLSTIDVLYRSNQSSEVHFEERAFDTTEAIIDVNAGQQIPLGETITEMGVLVGVQDVLVFRDTFGGITLDVDSSGRSFSKYMELPIEP